MTKSERVAYIQARLAELYPDPPVPLDHTDAYSLLVAVLLSAQCTDVRVNLITPHLFKLARSPAAMALVPLEQIEVVDDTDGQAQAVVGWLRRLGGL